MSFDKDFPLSFKSFFMKHFYNFMIYLQKIFLKNRRSTETTKNKKEY